MDRVNPGGYLEDVLTELLDQRIYTIEFAHRLTLLERFLESVQVSEMGLSMEAAASLTAVLNRVRQAVELTREFAETADLPKLDQAFGAARLSQHEFAALAIQHPVLHTLFEPETSDSSSAAGSDWTHRWETRVQRHRGISRATFRCLKCGWELSYAAEVGATEQLEVPFDELDCPLCQAGEAMPDEPPVADSLPTGSRS